MIRFLINFIAGIFGALFYRKFFWKEPKKYEGYIYNEMQIPLRETDIIISNRPPTSEDGKNGAAGGIKLGKFWIVGQFPDYTSVFVYMGHKENKGIWRRIKDCHCMSSTILKMKKYKPHE